MDDNYRDSMTEEDWKIGEPLPVDYMNQNAGFQNVVDAHLHNYMMGVSRSYGSNSLGRVVQYYCVYCLHTVIKYIELKL